MGQVHYESVDRQWLVRAARYIVVAQSTAPSRTDHQVPVGAEKTGYCYASYRFDVLATLKPTRTWRQRWRARLGLAVDTELTAVQVSTFDAAALGRLIAYAGPGQRDESPFLERYASALTLADVEKTGQAAILFLTEKRYFLFDRDRNEFSERDPGRFGLVCCDAIEGADQRAQISQLVVDQARRSEDAAALDVYIGVANCDQLSEIDKQRHGELLAPQLDRHRDTCWHWIDEAELPPPTAAERQSRLGSNAT